MIYPAQISTASTGKLQIALTSEAGFFPIENAQIAISYTGTTGNVIDELTTDSDGKTLQIDLPAPNPELSQEPSSEQPYSEYTLSIRANDYEPVIITGVQVLPQETATQAVTMRSSDNPNVSTQQIITPAESIVIGPHTLFGDYPPKIPEAEVKSVQETGEIVLSSVVIPEFIIVHDGPPNDSGAANYYVRYGDYIKNVASNEIYSTWPDASLRANILAIMSLTLNRVYTEWYRGRGKNFTITSSTAYDQKFIYGRNTFENINRIVDELFTSYLARPNINQPIMTQYCDGVRVNCLDRGWMTQWGSKELADNGLSYIEILRNYYGDNIYTRNAEAVAGVPYSYPDVALRSGSTGDNVRIIQEQLNAISNNFPLIPKLRVDGVFGPSTEEAVRTFQQIFDLSPDGVVGLATWYAISNIYVAVTRIAERF